MKASFLFALFGWYSTPYELNAPLYDCAESTYERPETACWYGPPRYVFHFVTDELYVVVSAVLNSQASSNGLPEHEKSVSRSVDCGLERG